MKISAKDLASKLIWALTTFLLMLFVVFQTTVWGRYVFFFVSVLIVLLSAVYDNLVLRIRIQPYHLFFLLFALYTLISAGWAIAPSDAISKAVTLAQILLCASLLYIHYDHSGDMTGLLRAFMWSGYCVALYTLIFYGLDRIIQDTGDVRFGSDFANANTMGMVVALSCVIQFSELLNKRKPWSAIFMVPAVIVVGAVQSRKALIMLLGGIVGIVLLRDGRQRKFLKKFFKTAVIFAVILAGVWVLLQLPMFSGLMERVESMLAYWTGEGKVDGSTIIRNRMIQLGISLFLEYPLFGVGIGNAHIFAAQHLKRGTYLHNNYVELLSSGGLIGFAVYYSAYIYVLIELFRYRKADYEKFAVGVVWLVLMLIMDYGMVSYNNKLQWYYMLFHFLNVSHLKKKHREMQQNAEEASGEGN